MGLEFAEQRVLRIHAQFVAPRVGNHGDATCLRDPPHRVAQRGPAVLDEARLAFDQVLAEHLVRAGADAGLYQVAGKVRAGNQLRVAGIVQRALEGILDTDFGQAFGHFVRPRDAAIARGGQAAHQRAVLGVDAEADDVHRQAGKGDRDLHARQKRQADGPRGITGPMLSVDDVVVSERPQLDSVSLGARGQSLGGQRAVRHTGMAVQIGVGPGGREFHQLIVGSAAGSDGTPALLQPGSSAVVHALDRPVGRIVSAPDGSPVPAGCLSAHTASRRGPGARHGCVRPASAAGGAP